MGHYEDPYSPTSIMECHVRILITVHMCCCPELVVQSERYPIDRLNIAINHHESRFVQPRTMHVRGIFLWQISLQDTSLVSLRGHTVYTCEYIDLYIFTLCISWYLPHMQTSTSYPKQKHGPLREKTNRPNLGCFQKKTTRKTRRKHHHPSHVTSEGWKLRDRDAGCTIRRWGCRNSGLLSVALVVNSDSHGYSPMVYW